MQNDFTVKLDAASDADRAASDADRAESLLRKAQLLSDYRSSDKLRDAAWNAALHEQRVTRAHAELLTDLSAGHACGLKQD